MKEIRSVMERSGMLLGEMCFMKVKTWASAIAITNIIIASVTALVLIIVISVGHSGKLEVNINGAELDECALVTKFNNIWFIAVLEMLLVFQGMDICMSIILLKGCYRRDEVRCLVWLQLSVITLLKEIYLLVTTSTSYPTVWGIFLSGIKIMYTIISMLVVNTFRKEVTTRE